MTGDAQSIRLLKRIKKAELIAKTKTEKEDWAKILNLVTFALKDKNKI